MLTQKHYFSPQLHGGHHEKQERLGKVGAWARQTSTVSAAIGLTALTSVAHAGGRNWRQGST